MSKPIAVLTSDIHFNLQNLELASQALLKAQYKAKVLDIPLVIAGDLMDTKANMRAEVVNQLIQLLSVKDKTDTIILVGNHDLCNEKGKPHSLNFLKPYATIIENPSIGSISGTPCMLVPYESDVDKLRLVLKDEDTPKLLIMHQGLQGSDMGDYFQDKSALNHEDVSDFRVISGHYHRRQDIKTGRPQKGAVGLFSYIGNPYTMSYVEADDPPKGFQILMDDGSLEFVPTNLRKHVVVDIGVGDLDHPDLWQYDLTFGDLLWVKVSGDYEWVKDLTRQNVARDMELGDRPFKLDIIPSSTKSDTIVTKSVTSTALFEQLIDSLTNTTDERKLRLKELYKHLGS